MCRSHIICLDLLGVSISNRPSPTHPFYSSKNAQWHLVKHSSIPSLRTNSSIPSVWGQISSSFSLAGFTNNYSYIKHENGSVEALSICCHRQIIAKEIGRKYCNHFLGGGNLKFFEQFVVFSGFASAI